MCARITITTPKTEIADLFGLSYDMSHPRPLSSTRAGYNIAPSAIVPVVRTLNGMREVADLRWGLIPHWNTSLKPTAYPNARAETAAEKPAFRDPFRWRRCLVPANGFFEWKTVGKKKCPYFFRKAGGGMLVCAAVWDRWMSPSGPVDTVAVLTVPANELVQPLHDRMPAIIEEGRFGDWLDPKESRPAKLLSLLEPYPIERMEKWAVSERVNAVSADGADLLDAVPEPLAPTWTQPTLFDVA